VIGRPGEPWRVAGAGLVRFISRGGDTVSAGNHGVLELT
jgi:hypothetical protein